MGRKNELGIFEEERLENHEGGREARLRPVATRFNSNWEGKTLEGLRVVPM